MYVLVFYAAVVCFVVDSLVAFGACIPIFVRPECPVPMLVPLVVPILILDVMASHIGSPFKREFNK